MIATCLIKDPTKRPPAKRLLKHPFFRRARSDHNAVKCMLNKVMHVEEHASASSLYLVYLSICSLEMKVMEKVGCQKYSATQWESNKSNEYHYKWGKLKCLL
jgi:serine/threonine protein kinase